jgi:hypothetical protein
VTDDSSDRWIGVLADDFTGAAELAGAAHARGLRAAVFTSFDEATILDELDVVAVDADTRSAHPHVARQRTADLAAAMAARQPAWLYKKCDSVLRGQVRLESLAMMHAAGYRAVQLCPANPTRGRVIRGGRYLVNGVPLHETAFARDPEHPRLTDDVRELLGHPDPREFACNDAERPDQLARLADDILPNILPAGAVEFFEALLDRRRRTKPPTVLDNGGAANVPFAGRTLFVCGSAAGWRGGRREVFTQLGWPVATLPDGDPLHLGTIAGWSRNIADAAAAGPPAAAAVGRDEPVPGVTPAYLSWALAMAVAAGLQTPGVPAINRLCVEGGGTAADVVRAMGWNRLDVARNWATGVVELRPAPTGPTASRPAVVAKVGSYDWPAAILAPSEANAD